MFTPHTTHLASEIVFVTWIVVMGYMVANGRALLTSVNSTSLCCVPINLSANTIWSKINSNSSAFYCFDAHLVFVLSYFVNRMRIQHTILSKRQTINGKFDVSLLLVAFMHGLSNTLKMHSHTLTQTKHRHRSTHTAEHTEPCISAQRPTTMTATPASDNRRQRWTAYDEDAERRRRGGRKETFNGSVRLDCARVSVCIHASRRHSSVNKNRCDVQLCYCFTWEPSPCCSLICGVDFVIVR